MRLEVSHQDHSLLLLCWLPRAQDSEPSFFPEQTFSFFPVTIGSIPYQNCCSGRLGTQFLDFCTLLSNWFGKIRVSFFIIIRKSWGDILRLWKVLFFSIFHTLVLASTEDFCRNQWLLWRLKNGGFVTPSILACLYLAFCPEEPLLVLHVFTYLFTYLFKSLWTNTF